MNRAGWMCERCGNAPAIEVHHHNGYKPWGLFDLPQDLQAVCHRCHCEVHGVIE
jgi:hypothetical protein